MDDESSNPLVSVVVPTYNRLEWLHETVASIRAQDAVLWELLVIDDGSDDGTDRWIQQLNEPRLRYIRAEHHGNIATVRNLGLAAARGSWVAFLDSDDLWLTGKLQRQLARLAESPDARWCYGDYQIINELSEPIPRPHGVPWHACDGWIVEQILQRTTVVPIATLMVRADLARQLQFDPRTSPSEDYDFALRLASAAPGCAVNQQLAQVRVHPGRATRRLGPFAGHLAKAITFKKAFTSLAHPRLRQLARTRYREHVAALVRYAIRHAAFGQLFAAIRSLRATRAPLVLTDTGADV